MLKTRSSAHMACDTIRPPLLRRGHATAMGGKRPACQYTRPVIAASSITAAVPPSPIHSFRVSRPAKGAALADKGEGFWLELRTEPAAIPWGEAEGARNKRPHAEERDGEA